MVRKIVSVICDCLEKIYCRCKEIGYKPNYIDSIEYWKRIEHVDHDRPPKQKQEGRKMIGKLRPQIFLAIVVLGILAGIGATNGVPELATATIGGIIALGMKVLENE